MIPYADFTYFVLLLYVAVPTVILGLIGRAGWRWALLITTAMLLAQYHDVLHLRAHFPLREIWMVLAFALWQWLIIRAFASAGARAGWPFYGALGVSLLPLVLTKLIPLVSPHTQFGFLGISYVTFRALDLVFCLRDGVIETPGTIDLFMFLFFFPTISSGPIDRYRRFLPDWRKRRSRTEFLADLDGAVQHLFRGLLYKFILAALIEQYWLKFTARGNGFGALLSYMYAYSFYLFFDFAGYSAFAISVSYLFGIHTPENFNRPFLARNIRDFWNRWHITLSFWFRDHVYMRFLLAAGRGKWFKNLNTAAILGYFLAFGLMGLWHGIELHYILYGLYQATLLSAFHIFSNWKKVHQHWREGPLWNALALFLTFNAVCFGLLIFSGHLSSMANTQRPSAEFAMLKSVH
ncbi:MAG TPA: D-alanyl-lipoteichoic acid biosynthesis protein DltB [Candidatus Udaeobacter sp.]|nr:D-alanyl-lipoteichoic acid biosynthesis protein DltB [Candidatus Udaeobacter sp.]